MLETVLAFILLPFALIAVVITIVLVELGGFAGKAFRYGGRGVKAAVEDLEAKATLHKQQAERNKEETYVEVEYETPKKSR